MTELITEKAKKIRALFLDVDGVLTNGSFALTAEGTEIKQFHTHDGYGLKQLQQQGIVVAIISSRNSQAVTYRMQELNISHVYQGVATKISIYEKLLLDLKLNDEQIAYMGDDIPDLAILKRVGLSIAPANAVTEVKQNTAWVTQRSGGQGAVREVCDFILAARQCIFN